MIAPPIETAGQPGIEKCGTSLQPSFDERLAAHFEKTAVLLWFPFSLAYFFLAASASMRLFWYDEFFTHYLADFPPARMWQALLAGIDQNGPFFYLLSSATRKLAGNPELGLRIPAILGGWCMLLGVFLYVRKRCSAAYAWVAVLFLINSHAIYYTAEARPYGLVLGCCAISFFAWQEAAERQRRRMSLALLLLSLMAAGLCHAYAVLLYVPLALGELARTLERRRIDWLIWMIFAGSSLVYAFYIPIVRGVHGNLTHTWAPPQLERIPESYENFFGVMWLPFFAMLVLLALHSLFLPARQSASRFVSSFPLPQRESVVLAALLLLPFAGLAIGRFTGIFTGRYVIETVIGAAIIFAVLLWRATQGRAAFALAICLISMTWEFWRLAGESHAFKDHLRIPPVHESARLVGAYELLPYVERSDLPLVVSSGLMFLPIDHYGSPRLVGRLHLLVDPDAAVAHTNVDLFDRGFPVMKRWMPLRGRIDKYREFIALNPHFYVYGYWDSRETNDWLIDRLLRDGAQITALGKTDGAATLPAWAVAPGDSRYLYLFDVRVRTL